MREFCVNQSRTVRFDVANLAEARRKLLDFSIRNRLLSFKHPDRGVDFLRVVDELTDELFKRLMNGAIAPPDRFVTEVSALAAHWPLLIAASSRSRLMVPRGFRRS
jgi:hypothetical protein